jgi:dTDP-4-amino-4,6-dideoxygalactose transaminase
VACQALRLSGEVITTPFSFPATPHVLSWNAVTPVFADVEPGTMNIDPARIESLITGRTTGILGVHVYGTPCQVDAIDDLARNYGLKVIYDGAHAFGAQIDGRPIASFGDATMFSFHATKLFHTAEGGARCAMRRPSSASTCSRISASRTSTKSCCPASMAR